MKVFIVAALALSFAAHAQNEPALEIAPLVPPPAPWLKKKPKKPAPAKEKKPEEAKRAPPGAKKGKKPAPAQQAVEAPLQLPVAPLVPPAAEAQKAAPTPLPLPLPPLVPAAPVPEAPPLVKVANVVGVLSPDARIAQGVRGVAQGAPHTESAVALDAKPCDDACLAQLGASQKLDQLVIASALKGAVRVRLFDVSAKREITAADAAAQPGEELAVAEALTCKLLVPAGCTAELTVDAPPGVQLFLDGAPLPKKTPLGVHALEARSGAKSANRAIAVVAEAPARFAVDRDLRILAPGEKPAPLAVVTGAAPAAGRSPWFKCSGYIGLAAGGVGVIAATAFGLKSRSDLNAAEAAFHNGAYQPADALKLNSGNSAAHTANTLFVASAVCLAAGAFLTLAF